MLASGPARRNSNPPPPSLPPLPDSDSEFHHRVGVTYPGGETRDSALSLDAHPCDRRLGERVERVTFEHRSAGRENDDHRLVVHAQTLAPGG